jgi:ketosteroid isomerase-like protein
MPHLAQALRTLLALTLFIAPAALPAQTRTADKHPVTAGPLATKELFDELAEQDRRLFDIVFVSCDTPALAGMLADDFAFFHDKHGAGAASPQKFVEDIGKSCELQKTGVNIRARRELVPGTLEVFPMNNYGAIQTGTHRFFGIEPGKPDQLRETGKFFHVWKKVDGQWKLSRSYSYDHHPAP